MEFEAALHALGVRPDTLTSAEKQQLDEQGYLPLHGIFTRAQAAAMKAAMEALFVAEGTVAPAECGSMQNKSEAFDICLTHPRVIAAVAHVLQAEFRSLGVHTRPNPPGVGQQALHIDANYTEPGNYITCNSVWPLVDFTAENGATRIVPGSHRSGRKIEDELSDLTAAHPDEIQLIAEVGTVVIWNGHLWHGSTLNRSDHDRANVTSFWCRRELPEGYNFGSELAPEAAARLGSAVARLF